MTDSFASLWHVSHTWSSSGIQACRDASLNLHPGTVHALVGENGAGKTTLGNILAGALLPDSGLLRFQGKEWNLSQRRLGLIPGIGLVRQRSIWPMTLCVWEAAVLGAQRITRRKAIKKFIQTASRWKLLDLDPRQPINTLDVAALQCGQLVAALMHNPKILILDEPISQWKEGSSAIFFDLLISLKRQGVAIVLITHRLDNVLQMADSVTVMRHGRVVATGPKTEFDLPHLNRAMFGVNALPFSFPPSAVSLSSKNKLECRGVQLRRGGRVELSSVNFTVKGGEILSITGLWEDGLTQLENVIVGFMPPSSGAILFRGRDVTGDSIKMRCMGLRYIPSDAINRGASLQSTVTENMIVLHSRTLARGGGWLMPGSVRKWVDARRRSGGILGRPEQKMEELSGGNIRKVIAERELDEDADVIVASNPTIGLDARSRKALHVKLRQRAASGAAILFLTSDADEALEIGHRTAIMAHGRLSEVRPTEHWSRHQITAVMSGSELSL